MGSLGNQTHLGSLPRVHVPCRLAGDACWVLALENSSLTNKQNKTTYCFLSSLDLNSNAHFLQTLDTFRREEKASEATGKPTRLRCLCWPF